MEGLAFLISLSGIVWLAIRSKLAKEDVESLSRQVNQLELEIRRLKQRFDQPRPGPAEAPTETQAAAGTVAQLLKPKVEVEPVKPASIPTAPPAEWEMRPPLVATMAAAGAPPQPTRKPPTVLPPLIEPAMAASVAPTAPPAALEPTPRQEPLTINWEQFIGVKLFAWIGGLALFLSVVFFVKYSFDHDLISPEVRVALGFLAGIGLLVGGVMMQRKEYEVTAHTLCATGVVILYAVSFACHAYYHFTGLPTTFALMTLVTITAFLLAVKLDAQVVAVLGLVGAFVTPRLLATGEDEALGLFSYLAILDAGLMAIALRRRWHYLILMAAVGTVGLQLVWVDEFFRVEKIFAAMAIFLGFNLLFLLAFVAAQKLEQTNRWLSISAIGLPFVTLGFTFYLLGFAELGARPGVLFSFVLGADLCLLALVLLRHALHQAHLAAGAVVFVILTAWTLRHLTESLLNWALGFYLVFAVLHSVFPVVLQRVRPGVAPVWWGHLFPPVALLLVMVPLSKEVTVSWLIWPCVLMIDLVAIGLAVLTASLLSILSVLVLTAAVTAVWILKLPAELTGLPPMLFVIGGFAIFFFVIGIFIEKIIVAKMRVDGGPAGIPGGVEMTSLFGRPVKPDAMLAQIPALAAILPFLLLIMVSVRLPLDNPSPVFGLAMLMVALLLGVARMSRLDALVPVSLGCVLALEFAWHNARFAVESAFTPLVWYSIFCAVFIGYPFLFRRSLGEGILPWASAALSGPLHFFLVYRVIDRAYSNAYMGLVPAIFALPMLAGLAYLARSLPADHAKRNSLLAWFGGSALWFITLIFPIQFERQWITIGWALEGVALLWLFHRVPQLGLRGTGFVLLAIAFARLAFNPAVLSYHPRSETPILNWYLYAYGIVTVCLFAGAHLLAPPRHRLMKANVPPLLCGLGTVLAFFLLNIEIADYFSDTGSTLTFQFSGNFARDMTYTIAWAMFALAMLMIGIKKHLRPVRYVSLGLLSVSLIKLFFHDLSWLSELYRIGAFMGVAIIAIVASLLYQRFLAASARTERTQGSK